MASRPSLSAAKALGNQLAISRAVRSQTKHIALVERTSRPTNVTKVNVAVLVQAIKRSANILLTRSSVAATDLRQDSLTLVVAEPGSKRNERVFDVVARALGVGTRVVAVEVAVHVEDELVGRAVGVLDLEEGGAAGSGEGTRRCVVSTWEEDHLRLGAGFADSGYGRLARVGPGGHCEVVGLVHQAKGNVLLRCVLGCDLGPDIGELRVGWAALADDLAVPSGVVVEVEKADGTGGQAALDELIVGCAYGGVEGTSESVAGEMLPADRQTVDVELVVLGEVLHLCNPARTGVNVGAAARSRCVASEVETSNVHTGVLGLSVGRTSGRVRDSGLAGCGSCWRRGPSGGCFGGSDHGGLGSSGSRACCSSTSARDTLRVPIVLDLAVVAGHTCGGTSEALSTTLCVCCTLSSVGTACC
jgi:hypothetical protein